MEYDVKKSGVKNGGCCLNKINLGIKYVCMSEE